MKAAFAHWDGYELEFRLRQGETEPLRRTILPELRKGDVEGTVYIVGGDSKEHSFNRDDPLLGALLYTDAVLGELERAGEEVRIVRTAPDIDAARTAGATWFLLGLEGCLALRGEIGLLRIFHRLGVRSIGLTWNGRNEAADGVGVAHPGGLTDFGRELVTEMNALGMLIDVSHLAAPGLADVLEVSSAPVYASHSNARSLREHRRNLTDDQLRSIAAKGGVVGINFHPSFLGDGDVTIGHIAEQIEHVAGVIGIEQVAIGPDFTYDPWRQSLRGTRSYKGVPMDITRPYPIHRPGDIQLLRDELERRGMREDDIARVFGGNLVAHIQRVLSRTGAPARV